LINPLVVFENDWQDLPVQALETSPAPARANRLPQLLDLRLLNASLKGDLVGRVARYRQRGLPFFSVLFENQGSMDHTARHLRRQLLQKRPGDRRKHWFRYYDPVVFRHLTWLLSPTQLARLMGPITQWAWPDPIGHWQTLERPDEQPRIEWLELSRRQWDSIDRIAVLNHSVRRLTALAPHWPQDTAHWCWLEDTLHYSGEVLGLAVDRQQHLVEVTARHLPDLISRRQLDELLAQSAQSMLSPKTSIEQLSNIEWNTLISRLKERA